MTWATAWESPEGDADTVHEQRAGAGWGLRGLLLLLILLFVAVMAYALGLISTLGSAEGSERHNRFGVYTEEASSIGLGTMYLSAGQTAWIDYDVTVEGTGGIRLIIIRNPPQGGQIRLQRVTATGRGRLEYVVPEAGFYSFRHERVLLPAAFGHTPVGSTRYHLSWGVD